MTFWILIVALGVFAFPVLRRRMAQTYRLRYWESACFAFSFLFLVTSFFPLIGVPLVHPIRGEALVKEELIYAALLPALVLFGAGCALIFRRITRRNDGSEDER